MTLQTLLLLVAFVCACCGIFGVNLGKRSDGTVRRTPSWIALALAFWIGSLLVFHLR